ncbi:MAG: hypothetical protein C5B58_11765 [Acidobacteria bacterium]|nr:MAG: hypothetical protein C5B58_11765 [Acidobacteriota bacterium]
MKKRIVVDGLTIDETVTRHEGYTETLWEPVSNDDAAKENGKANGKADGKTAEGMTMKGDTLQSVRANTMDIEDYEWLWPGRFALKKIGLIVGMPDEGKSLLLSDIVARITRGAEWPCNEGQSLIGNVAMLSAEDDIADTIVPRLIAANADLERVHILKMVRTGTIERMFNLVTDLALLRQKVEEIGDVRMVTVDPLTAYLGVGKVDSFRATDVRAILSPLKEFAETMRISVLGVMHFNKKTDVTNIMLRVSDSLAYSAASRHVYGIVGDPGNHRRLFVKGKGNLAKFEQPTLAFGIDVREVGTDHRTSELIHRPFVVWHDEPVDITATEALSAVANNKSPNARDHAKNFFKTLFRDSGNEPIPSTEVYEAARENGISKRTLERVRKDLGIEVRRDGPISDKGAKGWRWHPPTKG